MGGATKTCSLPFMNNFANKGDWYVLANDAHAAFFVADKATYSQCTVDLLLNGAEKTFVITSANDLASGRHKTDLAFDVMAGDGRRTRRSQPPIRRRGHRHGHEDGHAQL